MDARWLDPGAFQAPHEEQERLTRLVNDRLAMMRLGSGAVAAKYTPPETLIDIAVSRGDGVVQIEVADRGPRLPLGEEQQALERSYRGRPETSQGAGSGLAICRAIVEAHGGTIRAENRPWDEAWFRVTLPVKVQPPERAKDA